MSNVFRDLKPKNHAERNGFDLSRRSVFSTKVGQILPVFVQPTLPDSEYKIDVRQLLRTQPLQTAAFTGFSINYDFFFVPNNYGFSSFNEFISQREDSQHVGQPSVSNLPRFQYNEFIRFVVTLSIWDYLISTHFTAGGYYVSAGTEAYPRFLATTTNAPWQSLSLSVVRSLDMFGYGNFLPYVKDLSELLYQSVFDYNETLETPKDITNYVIFLEVFSELYNSGASVVYFDNLYTILQNFLIGISSGNLIHLPIDGMVMATPTLWPVLAYNKAFYEFYRNSYYDTKYAVRLSFEDSVSPYYQEFDYVQLFNFDDWTSEYLADEQNFSINLRFLAIFALKHHLYKKDLFTGVLPSTQFGDVSVMTDNRDWMTLYVRNNSSSTVFAEYSNIGFSSNTVSGGSSIVGSGQSSTYKPRSTSFRFDPALAISVLEQRRADSMQRFKERMMRAGNKVKDVFKAHGWSEPRSASSSEPVFIGTFDGRLDINTVAATSPSGSVELGQLGANGVGVVNGKPLRFKTSDFGVIVGVMYIVKDAEYDAYGLEKQHMLIDPFDYPYPELQNISLAPVDTLELTNYLLFDDFTRVLGYLPRFMEYKTSVDKVHGEFYSASIYPNQKGEFDSSQRFTPSGVFSDWVTPRMDVNAPTALSFLYQSPRIADNIFLVQADERQETDQFLVNAYFDVMAVEPVSVIGLPI